MRLKSFNFFFNQLSHDCRSTDSDAIMEALSGHEEFYEGCMVEPFPTSLNSSMGWEWPGNYPYASMDTAFFAFMGCLKTLYIGVCCIYFLVYSNNF